MAGAALSDGAFSLLTGAALSDAFSLLTGAGFSDGAFSLLAYYDYSLGVYETGGVGSMAGLDSLLFKTY